MSEVNLIINNDKVKAERGTTILQAARNVGIDIPALCHCEKLGSYGACRLCTVEIVKGQRSRLVTSCTYNVEDGLVVNTESQLLTEGRKMLLELMWVRAPGVQPITNYGKRYGISGVLPIRDYRVICGIASPPKPKFELEPSFCILCGLCVRYCKEVKKKNAIGFVGRGTEREIVFFPEIARHECPNCQECYSLCPTGILPSHHGLIEACRTE